MPGRKVHQRFRYGLGALACRVGGTKNAFGAFDAWLKSATWQFRNGMDMDLVPLHAGLVVPKRRLERLMPGQEDDAWPRKCCTPVVIPGAAFAKVKQGSADTSLVCSVFWLFKLCSLLISRRDLRMQQPQCRRMKAYDGLSMD